MLPLNPDCMTAIAFVLPPFSFVVYAADDAAVCTAASGTTLLNKQARKFDAQDVGKFCEPLKRGIIDAMLKLMKRGSVPAVL